MGDILVRYKNKKYRMWNTTIDMWTTQKMDYVETIEFLTAYKHYPHSLREAVDRIERNNMDRAHMLWLVRWFDSRVAQLTKLDKKLNRIEGVK